MCFRRISNDVLELVEQSLDVNLSGNRVRFRFTDTPILDGITIHEFYGSVIILVPTVCSVHRLVFNHPDKIHKQVCFTLQMTKINDSLTVYSVTL